MPNQRNADFSRLLISMKNLIGLFVVLLSLVSVQEVFATHNRAGVIIYRRTGNGSFEYEITIVTYTKTGGQSNDADRCELTLHFGDGQKDTIQRVNGVSQGDCPHFGEPLGNNTKRNVYRTTHTYPGVGTYRVHMQDQNRNAGVKNIPSSDNVWFYIESEIVIDVSSGGNTAPTLQNAPIDNGCEGEVYYHNPGAVDPDGDSLVYSLVKCKTFNGQTIPGFQFPNNVSGQPESLTIDARTGTLTWDSPQEQGEYNIAIRIEEWRHNDFSGDLVFVGSVLRDMQIDISPCEPKEPPIIGNLRKECVEAGRVLVVQAIATDADDDPLDFSGTGFPLNPGEGGSLNPIEIIGQPQPVEIDFTWRTRCDHIQYEPYWAYFKAKENLGLSNEELVDFEELEIQVIPPAVTITEISPAGAALRIKWTEAPCDGSDGYDVYRFNDSLGYVASNCNVGVPEELGYQFVGRIDGQENLEFLDDNDGEGLIHGEKYCYMVVATYPDRSESYASLEECAELIRDVPILNKASINVTDAVNGSDSVAWFKPIEFDPSNFDGPYKYRLTRTFVSNNESEVVYESPATMDFLSMGTFYVDQDINTENDQFIYSIDLLWGPDERPVGKSRNASSIFLSSTPADNELSLSWNVEVPWTNFEYIIYKFKTDTDSLDVFYELGRTSELTFLDTGLVNLRPYRYMIKSIGNYTSGDLRDTLVNWSQIHTGIPEDTEKPCTPPNRVITGDCNLDETSIIWNNPNDFCPDVDDVVGYNIYYAPQIGETMDLVQNNDGADDTTYFRPASASIAGCYLVTAVDSFGNESDSGSSLCIDNCPIYELPNVFTPGQDGFNDLFRPFAYKYIESINITIFNRWGRIVYETKDPDINWDGIEQNTGRQVSDGVYYYVCSVNEIRLVGIVTRELKGSFTIFNENKETEIAK